MRVSLTLAVFALLAACGGGGGGGSSSGSTPVAPAPEIFLTVADVQRVVAQAVGESTARNLAAHVAVVDRVGNVLAIFRMNGAVTETVISSGLGVTGGLENATVLSTHAAVSKAITAAYLSSNGNAFTTRTANQIIQENFNPGESQQPSGPLYGVQFSQLACSDVINSFPPPSTIGPRASPLGLAADPGGLPLYKAGILVGGVGVEVDGHYGIDRNIDDVDAAPEETIAAAGTFGFEAPADIRADRITADGRTFRFTDSTPFASNPAAAPSFASLPGGLVALAGYNEATLAAGNAFGAVASGVRAAGSDASGPWILADASGANRFPVRASIYGAGSLTAAEVEAILTEGFAISRRARGQIRRPLGSTAEVTLSVVDRDGFILGIIRTPDAPVFGIDVAVQKARTAAVFSKPGGFGSGFADFVGPGSFDGSTAWTPRAIGNLHRPTYPDGIEGTPNGPFSTPMSSWSPFDVGLQLDLVKEHLVFALTSDPTLKGCAGSLGGFPVPPPNEPDYSGIPNGIQIFPGGVPIYRGTRLIGAVGISGDGVDQDDMIAFLGLANAAQRLNTGFGNAPAGMRADRFAPMGVRLRYVQCPQSPFNGSTEQNVCAGL